MSVGIPGNSFFFDTNVSNVEKKQTKKEESKKATPEEKKEEPNKKPKVLELSMSFLNQVADKWDLGIKESPKT